GMPHKNFLNDVHSGSKAIVTDTLNSYPQNNSSSFTITLLAPVYQFTLWYMSFSGKADCDSLNDGIIISASNDNGLTWYNLIAPGGLWSSFFGNAVMDTPSISGKSSWSSYSYFNCSADSLLHVVVKFTF